MTHYDSEEQVSQYVKAAQGYDGRALIEALKEHLQKEAVVLELGMGPGKDLEILQENFQVVGSDYSQAFLDRYRRINPNAKLLQLDAVKIDTPQHFDAIYSNKVMHLLSQEELSTSLQRQFEVLNPEGILLHSFWYGDGIEQYGDMRVTLYTEATLSALVGEQFEVIALERYREMEDDDSLYVILKKR
jgi:trans-aconitate methyltransferase